MVKSNIVLTADSCIRGQPSDYVLKIGDQLEQDLFEFGARNLTIVKTETFEGLTLIKIKNNGIFPENSDLGLDKANPEIDESVDFVGTVVRPVCLKATDDVFEASMNGVTEFIGLKTQKENEAPVTDKIKGCDGLKHKTCTYHTETKRIETRQQYKKLGGWLIAKTEKNRFNLVGFENNFGVYTLLNEDYRDGEGKFEKLLRKINKN